ncbi:outer membrane lipoprotein Omp10 [Pararhizobium haloflavum]|uniref:outer membrane lipoprotein Omp10 n=1 Tax=Pararhizobium haloflavum TaxID=2037914 RepID=UPI000C179E0D|nr:outer membrane lipoprotein Omp10 [Pararhizobium haloflavum]
MNRYLRLSCLAGMAVLLAACQSAGPNRQLVLREVPQQRGPAIEGDWVDPNGIVSSFNSGRFETRTTDTNSLLADGSYTLVSDRLVEIDMTSRVRGTQSQVNCALVSPSQLNCTSDSGSQFSLARRAAG